MPPLVLDPSQYYNYTQPQGNHMPVTNVQQEIRAPQPGRVIGMALNQFVMPGYAAFHLGVEAPDGGTLPESPSAEEIDHSVALADGMLDERDDSDE